MSGTYHYSPDMWPSFIAAISLVALGIYVWRRRRMPGALPLAIACLFAAMCAAGSVMEYAALDLATRIFWFKFQAAWYIPIVTAVTCYMLEYAWPGRWLTGRNLLLLSLPCFLALAVVLMDELNHLTWRSFEFQGRFQPQFGPSSWIFSLYGLGILVALDLLVLGWLFLRAPHQRWPAILMLVGQLGGRTVFLLERANLIHSALPIELLGITFEFLIYAIALFGFQILDPIPLARRMAIEQLHAGMLVLDARENVVSLNPAARAILCLPEKRILKRPIRELLQISDEALNAGQTEIELRSGQETRYYQLGASTLTDWRGLEVGRLLLMHDVTGQRQAQKQLLEHQRALAMLHEREQLARELHDSIGQVLGHASLKMSATRKFIADGKLAKADDQLAQLEDSLSEAHADVREYILNLRIAPSAGKPFFSALQSYLDGLRQNYGMQVGVSIGPDVCQDVFAPEAQVQLFRILQEGLSNARKHAGAKRVQISFERQGGLVRIRIQDCGRGFDPQQVMAAGGDHYGLRIMQERAQQLGGALRVQSAPGEGTCVELDVPVGEMTETRPRKEEQADARIDR